MPERTKVAFKVLPNEPLVLIAEGVDGRQFKLEIRLAIVEVVDTGVPQPQDPTLPTFEFKAQMLAETRVFTETTKAQ